MNDFFVGHPSHNTSSFWGSNTPQPPLLVPLLIWSRWSHSLWHYHLGMKRICTHKTYFILILLVTIIIQMKNIYKCTISFPFFFWFHYRLETVNIKCKGGKAKILGTFVCIGGALLLTLYKGKPLFDGSHYQSAMDQASSTTRSTQKWTIGVIALIMGTLFWSFWFILQSKIGKRYPCQYSSTAIMTFFGAMQAAILGFSTGSSNLSSWVLKDKIQIITVLYSVSSTVF